MKRIVIFASGSGSNAENLIKFFHNSDNASVIQVLTNNPHAKVLDRCKKLNISALSFNKMAFSKSEDVLNILKAFNKANDIANAQRMEHIKHFRAAGLIDAATYDALGEPLVQHGIRANRETLEAAALYSFEQSLTERQVTLEEVFAKSTLDQ